MDLRETRSLGNQIKLNLDDLMLESSPAFANILVGSPMNLISKCKSWRNGRRMAAAVSGMISDDPGGSNPHKALARWGADGRAGSSPADLHLILMLS